MSNKQHIREYALTDKLKSFNVCITVNPLSKCLGPIKTSKMKIMIGVYTMITLSAQYLPQDLHSKLLNVTPNQKTYCFMHFSLQRKQEENTYKR